MDKSFVNPTPLGRGGVLWLNSQDVGAAHRPDGPRRDRNCAVCGAKRAVWSGGFGGISGVFWQSAQFGGGKAHFWGWGEGRAAEEVNAGVFGR